MCECGCTGNDFKYKFPGPGESFYILTLAGMCIDCDSPPGITLEHILPTNSLYEDYKQNNFLDGSLKFERWADTLGVAIITGRRQNEFIKAMTKHLVGLSSEMLEDDGKLDKIGAETILEEMYEDSQVKPHLVEPKKPRRKRTVKFTSTPNEDERYSIDTLLSPPKPRIAPSSAKIIQEGADDRPVKGRE